MTKFRATMEGSVAKSQFFGLLAEWGDGVSGGPTRAYFFHVDAAKGVSLEKSLAKVDWLMKNVS